MQNKYAILLFSLLILQLNAQNIVPNPSFEDTLGCPTTYSEIYKTKGWNNCGGGTTDFFYDCPAAGTTGGVPANVSGYQAARTGKGYGGFANYNGYAATGVEILTAKLVIPMTVNRVYYVKFWVSRGDKDSVSSNKIGLKFSMNSCDFNSMVNFNNVAHIYTNTIITDRFSWSQISGIFIPDSAYQYISIGNFFTQAQTSILPNNIQGGFVSYYYVDDICVSLDPNKCSVLVGIEETTAGSEIALYPNPSTGLVKITNHSYDNIKSITVRNMQGQHIKTFDTIHAAQYTLDLLAVEKGIYVLMIDMGSGLVSKRIVIDN